MCKEVINEQLNHKAAVSEVSKNGEFAGEISTV